MKKMLCLLVFSSLTLSVALAQSAETNKKKNVQYSIAWGLFKSPDYANAKTTVAHVQKPLTATVTKSAIDTNQYAYKSILWGAIQWTEKKSIVSPSNSPQK